MKSTFGIAYAAVLAGAGLAARLEAEEAKAEVGKLKQPETPEAPVSRQVRRAMERSQAKAARRGKR